MRACSKSRFSSRLIRLGSAAVCSTCLLLASGARAAETITKTFDAGPVKRLDLDSAAGAIKIKGGTSKTATVVARKIKFAEGCELSVDLNGDTLRIENKEPLRSLGGDPCQVELDLEVPRALATDLALGTGDVTIEDVSGELIYKLGSGDVEVRNADLGKLDGKSGSGDVKVAGMVANVDLKIGAGDVAITLNKAPSAGKIDLKVGTGDAVVNLPKSAKIKSSFKAGLGSLTNELGDSPSAKFSISGTAGTGDLTIRRL